MTKTLAAGLESASIDFEILHKKYNPVLSLVEELIGIIPNCDPILEIWPPGFRSYNLLVPNLFNLPVLLFGNKSFKASVGLAMYSSSKTASCAYCTAHACSFALRRGASTDAITGNRTPKEMAVVALAEGLARIPSDLTMSEVNEVKKYFSDSQIEWLVLSVAMMGFLNKCMNALGIPLEQDAINDTAPVLSQTGWKPGYHVNGQLKVTKETSPKKDNLLTYLRVIRQAPGAISLEKKWTQGVPDKYPQAAAYLKEHTGYSFPILKPITQGRVVRAVTTVLKDNLDKELTEIGLKTKLMAGYIFTRLVVNDDLVSELKNVSTFLAPELNEEAFDTLDEFVYLEIPGDLGACKEVISTLQQRFGLQEKEAAALLLAIATSPSPAHVNEALIETVLSLVSPKAIVEIVVWLSVLQMLHRLNSFHTLLAGKTTDNE